MKNHEIAQLARDKGYRADNEKGGVIVRLINRKPSMMEIGRELDIPRGLLHNHRDGILVYGSDS